MLRDCPVDNGFGHAEVVQIEVVVEAYAGIGLGKLLGVEAEHDGGSGRGVASLLEPGCVGEACEVERSPRDFGEFAEDGFLDVAALDGAQERTGDADTGTLGLIDDDVGHDGEEVLALAKLGRGFELDSVGGAADEERAE